MKADRRDLGLVPSLPLPLKAGVGPIFNNIKVVGLLNREAWSNKSEVLATNLRTIPYMVDNTFSGPELAHANCAMGSTDILSHDVLDPMGLESVQG